MSGNPMRQWPDNITSGEIRYEPSGVYEGGFILRDADHGIPVFGSVSAQVFNYPGQTEDIAKALCDRWNSYASSQAEIERLRTIARQARDELQEWINYANIPGSEHSQSAKLIERIDAALSGSKE